MPTTSLRYAGTASSFGWESPALAQGAPNSQSAAVSLTTGTASSSLFLRSYGFSSEIPEGAIILGVAATIRHRRSGSTATFYFVSTSLHVANSNVGTSKSNNFSNGWSSTAFASQTIGGAADAWGGVTADQVRSADFGFRLQVHHGGGSTATAEVDSVGLQITWEPGKTRQYYVRHSGVWKAVDPYYVRHAGIWKDNTRYVRHGGIWKKVYGQ